MPEFKIMARPCDECLVTRSRIVSGERAAEIIANVRRADSFFICHKGPQSRAGQIACRGVEDKVGPCQLHRVAGRLEAITGKRLIIEVDPVTLKPIASQERKRDD